jgi:hypothetical protein
MTLDALPPDEQKYCITNGYFLSKVPDFYNTI